MRISDWSSDVCSSDLLDGVTHQRPLDLLGAVVLVRAQVQRDDPVIIRNHPHPSARVLAITTTGDFIDAAHALTQFARAAAVLKVGLQKGPAGRRPNRQ